MKIIIILLILIAFFAQAYLVATAEPRKYVDLPTDTLRIELRLTEVETLYQNYLLANVPDAEDWVIVAIAESGWDLKSILATAHNNPIGMGARPYYDDVQGADMRYASYATKGAHARDLRSWIRQNPREKGEDFVSFLKRRGYNTNPQYYVNFLEIKKIYAKNRI